MKKFLLVSILTLFAFSASALYTAPVAEAAAAKKGAKKKGSKKKSGKKKGAKKSKTAFDGQQFIAAKAKPAPLDLDATFKKLDVNSDNKLSKEEFAKITDELPKGKKAAAAAAAPADAAKAKKTKKGASSTDEQFAALDTNKDGYLSLDEFKKFSPPAAKKKKTT